MKKKNILYVSFLVGVIAIFAYLVMADGVVDAGWSPELVSPITNQNISGNLYINVTATAETSGDNYTNVTVYFWNASSLADGVYNITLVDNDSSANLTFNTTIDSSVYFSDGVYNISINATNASDDQGNYNGSVFNTASDFIIIDNTAPTVVINTVNNTFVGNNSSFVFNVTITNDTGFTSLHHINITNSSGQGSDLSLDILGTSASGSITRLVNDFNITLNETNLTEGRNVISVYVNDTAGNNNNSDSNIIIVWLDTISPTVNIETGQPVNNWTWTDDSTPTLRYNFTDDTSPNASCELFIDEVSYGINSSVLNNTQTNHTPDRAVSPGNHSWYVNCTDLGNNVATSGTGGGSIFHFDYEILDLITPLNGTWTQTPNNGSTSFTFKYQSNWTENATCELHIINTSSSNRSFDLFLPAGKHSHDGVWNGTNGTLNNTESTITNNFSLTHDVAANWTLNCTWNNSQITVRNDDWYTLYVDNVTPTVPALSLTTATTSSLTIAVVTSADVTSCTTTPGEISGSGSSWTLVHGGLSSGTSYTFEVICSDSSGRASTGTGAFSTSSSSGSSGGGSSGGTSQSTTGQYEKTVWQSINKGETATVAVDNGVIGITEVSFKAKETTYGAWVEVQKLDALPATEKSFENKVYKNLKILANNVVDVMEDTATIKFKVEKKWLTDNNIAQGNMALFRLVEDEWTQLQTTLGTDDGTYVHYTAETPGFSYFVIGAKSAETVTAGEAGETAAPTTTTGEAVETVKEGMSKGWIVTVVVLLVVIGAIVFFWVRRK